MNTRNGTLSPISTNGQDWSPVTRYHNIAGENPYSPTLPTKPYRPGHSDGAMLNGMHPLVNGNPSPPNSVGRSSGGPGLYASGLSDSSINRRTQQLEGMLGEHYRVLKAYLGSYLNDEAGNPRPSRAKDKLTRLSVVQFQELSTDVYDESLRREQDYKQGGPSAPSNDTPRYLIPKSSFHPKRNQARQKLSTLPLERFRQLATDVFYELERRFPAFTGNHIARSASPATSVASRVSNRGPSSRTGTPNSAGRRPSPGSGYRASPSAAQGQQGEWRPGMASTANSFGRPLPKTLQSHTIVPNKGTLVEDDEDSGMDDYDAFGSESVAPRRQDEQSTKSMDMAHDRITADLRDQMTGLQDKVSSLEGLLRDRDNELQRLRENDKARDGKSALERTEWNTLRSSLEEKVEKTEGLNSSLRIELDKLRRENEDAQKALRAQIIKLESTVSERTADPADSEWRQRCKELERELIEHQQVTEEVRRDASLFLQEMRELSSRSDAAAEKEERLTNRVASVESELKEWKSRCARAKTQLRSLKASSIGLSSSVSTDLANSLRDPAFNAAEGLVQDVHVTKFQFSVDELLQNARTDKSEQTLESMRYVVKCVRQITSDVDDTSLLPGQSPKSSVSGDIMANSENQQAKLKSRVSATANNLITAAKNHASSNGLSPVSLLDAAASHLTMAVIELVRYVKVRPTPEDELGQDEEEDDRPMPLKPIVYSTYNPYATNNVNGNTNGANIVYSHTRSHSSKGGSIDTTGYSTYSSPYSGYDRQSVGTNGIIAQQDGGMTDFKNYLEDQVALLVRSIQPLVNLVRSSSVPTPADEQQIRNHIQDVSQAVEGTANKAYNAVTQLQDLALKKHAIPVVQVLEDCKQSLLSVDIKGDGREKIPPLAFKTARALKELVLRVERIESGELTVEQTLHTEL